MLGEPETRKLGRRHNRNSTEVRILRKEWEILFLFYEKLNTVLITSLRFSDAFSKVTPGSRWEDLSE